MFEKGYAGVPITSEKLEHDHGREHLRCGGGHTHQQRGGKGHKKPLEGLSKQIWNTCTHSHAHTHTDPHTVLPRGVPAWLGAWN